MSPQVYNFIQFILQIYHSFFSFLLAVEITKPTSTDDIDDFIIETKLNYVEPLGEFLLNADNNFYYTNLNHNTGEISNQDDDNVEDEDTTFGWEKQLWHIDKTKYFNNENWNKGKHDDMTANVNSNNMNADEFFNTKNDCEKHVVYHRLSDINSKKKIVFNWTINFDSFKPIAGGERREGSGSGDLRESQQRNTINFR